MNIKKKTYDTILNKVPASMPESGGIIGGSNGVIEVVEFDKGNIIYSEKCCFYAPDVKKLNQCIKKWKENNIDFYGLFHTHFYGVRSLSEGDRCYIEKIMKAMPATKHKLFFPVIVFPEKEMVVYVAELYRNHVIIETEDICFSV